MEELQTIVEMIAKLPTMALWVIAGFWAYKVIVIGSIYGVIKLAIDKTHNWLTQPKSMKLWSKTLDEATAVALAGEINRLCGNFSFIHMSDVEKLRKTIDRMRLEEALKEQKK